MRTQLVWQQNDEKSGKYVFIVSCFESTKYTCLGCMNYFCMPPANISFKADDMYELDEER